MAARIRFLGVVLIGFLFVISVYLAFAGDNAAAGMPKLETRVLGQSEFISGSRASVRIIVTDHVTGNPVKGASVYGEISPQSDGPFLVGNMVVSESSAASFQGKTDSNGTLEVSLKIKDVDEGDYYLNAIVYGLDEEDQIHQKVRVVRQQQILLTTDKPLYQPGQVIHIRALALKKPDRSALRGKSLVFEVEDAKGNKVFKKTLKTSEFGVASVDFQLANEVNMGRFTVRALIDKTKAEKTVTVERYVLPKFKVKFTPDKSYYLVGETVSGKVQVDYFFGKPVADGKVKIKASTFDFAFKDFAEISGRTDGTGFFKFEQALPDYFVGQPLEQGNAFVKFEVTVTDGADHSEKITQTVPVSAKPLQIIAVPEGGKVVPNVENIIYVMAVRPDGSPVETTVFVKPDGMDEASVTTDSSGIGEFKLTPKENSIVLHITHREGNMLATYPNISLSGSASEDSVLLRLDKALAKVGESVNVTVLSPSGTGTVYLDVISGKQTMLTKSLDLKKGKGSLTLPLSADLAGSLEINAYRISRSGQIVRDTRLLYVDPADDLSVKIKPDKDSYLPGKSATIGFDVKDKNGKGVAAAIGVAIVDESVFALQEMQPGMEKIYFLLEKELMEPKFEVHGLTPSVIVRQGPEDTFSVEKQNAAKVLFALDLQERQNNPSSRMYTLDINTYTDKLEKMREEWGKRVLGDYKVVSKAVTDFYANNKEVSLKDRGGIAYLAQSGLLDKKYMYDEWGRWYQFIPCGCGSYEHSLTVISLGPDGKKDTDDDIMVGGTPSEPDSARVIDSRRRFLARGDMVFKGGFAGEMEGDMFVGLPLAEAPMAADAVVTGWEMKEEIATKPASSGTGAKEEVRVRQFFPETMYFNPAVITDGSGKGSISLDAADSITTWRITATANSKAGQLGSNTEGLRVFQDFFIDIDLPVSLTQNDEVSIPVAVYNYLPSAQAVTLEITQEPWFTLMDSATKKLQIGESDVEAVYFKIKVKEIGNHKLTVHAMGSKMSDAIMRTIEVMPDGKEFMETINDRLDKSVEKTVNIPADAIDGASNILVKVYPGIFSQVVEGMDSLLQMPFGCFEQTSSTTYPNVLALDYMKQANVITPEIQMKAEQYINLGYQRLVTFEVPGGGFSWFGDPPANKVLTAYGLMEFSDMSKVYEIDESLIRRTQQWLIAQRAGDGSWTPDENYLHDESWGKIQHNSLLPTAWITWALVKSGYSAAELGPSITYLKEHAGEAKDPYTLAILCNALVEANAGDAAVNALNRLVDMKVEEDGKVYWKSEVSTVTFTRGKSADVETTGLAALALIKSGRYPDVVGKALSYIIQSKDPSGTWGSTQATITSLKALLASIEKRTQDVNAKVTVLVNGQEAGSFNIDKENSDVLRQVDCKPFVKEGANTIKILFEGKGSMLYQISDRYYIPWSMLPKPPGKKLVSIDVGFDRTSLAKDDILTSSVKVAYNGPGTADMVMVDLGTPPGFDVQAADFEKLVSSKVIQKYTVTDRQVILYFDKLEGGKPVEFKYTLKAKFPIKAKTPKSKAYLYYNPEINDTSAPVEITVK